MSPASLKVCKLGRGLMPILTLLVLTNAARALAVSPLFARGYRVLPAPQSVTFAGVGFPLASGRRLELAGGVKAGDVAVTTLREDLAALRGFPRKNWIKLHG